MAKKRTPLSATTNAPSQSVRRPRNAVATREAILQSAVLAFSRAGYDGVGLREIAGGAGVTAILVNRYFGSKEEMFAEAVKATFADGSLFAGDAGSLADRLAQAMVAKAEGTAKSYPFRMLVHSASNIRAALILRDAVAERFERPLAATLGGKDTGERAALILSLLVGFEVIYNVLGSTALTEADQSALSKRLAQMFKLLMEDKQAKKTEKAEQLNLFG